MEATMSTNISSSKNLQHLTSFQTHVHSDFGTPQPDIPHNSLSIHLVRWRDLATSKWLIPGATLFGFVDDP